MILEITFVLLAGLVLGIALSTGGILPGGILNSLLILGLNISLKQSINITYVFLSGGGLASALISYPKKNSLGRRLIDYDLMMMTMPMMMSGVIFGAMIKNALSELVIVIIFIILIVVLFLTAYQKLREFQRKEQQLLESRLNQPLMEKALQLVKVQEKKVQVIVNERLKQILQKEDELLPVDKLKTIGQIYLYTIIILLIKGGNNFDSFIGLQSCSFSTWVIFFLHMVCSYIYCQVVTEKRKEIDIQKESLGYVFKQNEKMTDERMFRAMFHGFLAGCAAASLSVGAGMVLVPIWFKQGLERNTATATSGPLVFISSSISFLISVLLGRYQSYIRVAIYFAVGFIWTYGIRSLIIYLIETYNLKKLTFYLMMGMMSVSFVIIIIMEYQIFRHKPTNFFKFDGVC